MKSLKEKCKEHNREFNEKYKEVKCSFHGCKLWSGCSTECNGLLDDHVSNCKVFSSGWHQAIAELTENVAPW